MGRMSEKSKTHIVLAEDDRYLVKVLSNKLMRKGLSVDIASDGIEAVEKVQKLQPDLLLLDIMMPNKNGFEVLKELKASKKTNNVRIIMLTNLGQDSDKEKAREMGADDYVIKSDIGINELTEKVFNTLKTSKKNK